MQWKAQWVGLGPNLSLIVHVTLDESPECDDVSFILLDELLRVARIECGTSIHYNVQRHAQEILPKVPSSVLAHGEKYIKSIIIL